MTVWLFRRVGTYCLNIKRTISSSMMVSNKSICQVFKHLNFCLRVFEHCVSGDNQMLSSKYIFIIYFLYTRSIIIKISIGSCSGPSDRTVICHLWFLHKKPLWSVWFPYDCPQTLNRPRRGPATFMLKIISILLQNRTVRSILSFDGVVLVPFSFVILIKINASPLNMEYSK